MFAFVLAIVVVSIFFVELILCSVFDTWDLVSGVWCVFVSLNFQFVYVFYVRLSGTASFQISLFAVRFSCLEITNSYFADFQNELTR